MQVWQLFNIKDFALIDFDSLVLNMILLFMLVEHGLSALKCSLTVPYSYLMRCFLVDVLSQPRLRRPVKFFEYCFMDLFLLYNARKLGNGNIGV